MTDETTQTYDPPQAKEVVPPMDPVPLGGNEPNVLPPSVQGTWQDPNKPAPQQEDTKE